MRKIFVSKLRRSSFYYLSSSLKKNKPEFSDIFEFLIDLIGLFDAELQMLTLTTII